MFSKKQICTNCRVGKESYENDRLSHCCPYIECWNNGKCIHYIPIEKPSIMDRFKRNKNKA